MVLEQPTTGERGAVQVKFAAGQKQLDQFIADADETGSFDRLFFTCHSPKGMLAAPSDRTKRYSDVATKSGKQRPIQVGMVRRKRGRLLALDPALAPALI
jgi:hypothetical protein